MKKKSEVTLDYLDECHLDKSLEKMFLLVASETLERFSLGKCTISLSLISENKMRNMNKKYRNIDRTTDVLSFAYLENDDEMSDIKDLGCILIDPKRAKKQAEEFSHPFKRELSFLFIHGILHLLGYDHQNEEDSEKMFALQNEILNNLTIDFYTDQKKLKKELKIAQSMAITPYSHFNVGAVLITKSGEYIRGFNIENSSYPATICAERVAIYSAYSRGNKKDDFVAMGLITSSNETSTCCGVCRQVMIELLPSYIPVYIYNDKMDKMLRLTVKGMLPYAFTDEDLKS